MFTFLWNIVLFSSYIGIGLAKLDIPQVAVVSIQQPPPLIGVIGRNTLNLQCGASGNPYPTLTWSFNGTKVTPGGKYYIYQESLLQVYRVSYEDSGAYRCHATNKYGSVFGQVNVRLHSFGSFKEGNKVGDKPRSLQATVGQSLKLDCPPNNGGFGQQYFWGDLPESTRPLFWTNGEPEELAFVGKDGALYFVYLTEEHLEAIKKMDGISCIIYQLQKSEQSVQYLVSKTATASDQNFAPTFGHDLDKETLGVVGDRKSLVCAATGRPKPKITWFKEGVKLNNDKGIINETSGMTLLGIDMELVLEPRLVDEGKYACEAKNSEGKVRSEGMLKLHARPTFTKSLPLRTTVVFGTTLLLECVAHAIPEPDYEWHFKDQIVTASDGIKINKGVLEIPSVNFDHGGLYLCVASNYLTTIVSPSFVTIGAFGPTITSKLANPSYFFKTYENSLKCEATGGPKPSIDWLKDDKQITDSRFKLPGDGSIVVTDTKDEDGGTYKCVVKNVNSEKTDFTLVKVVEKTVITKKPAKLTYPQKYPIAQFICDATYDKSLDVTLTWQKNGQPIEFNKRVYIKKRVKGLSGRLLFINNVELSDAAMYTCTVFTKDGDYKVSEDVATGWLAVLALPEAPKSIEMEGNCASDDAITLMWEPGNSHGMKIISFIIEYAEVNDKTSWLTLKETDDNLNEAVIKVEDLPSENSLVFRVTAVTSYGGQRMVGKASPSTNDNGMCVVPLGNAPAANPSNVKSKIDGPGSLEFVWDILPENLRKEDTEYVVGYRKKTDPPSKFTNSTVAGDVNSFVVPNAGEKEEYEVFVQAKNKNGDGPPPKIYTFYSGEASKPSQVKNVQKTSADSMSVGLKWDPVDTAIEYQIDWEYENQRKRRSDVSAVNTKKTSNTTVVITGLESSRQLKFTVSAININGNGPASVPLLVQTSKAVPSMPSNVKVQVIGDAVRITWEPPKDGADDVDGYELRWYKTNDPSNTKKSQAYGANDREAFVAGGMEPLEYYTFELVPKTKDNKEGVPYKVDRLAVGYVDAPGQPGAPILKKIEKVEKKDENKEKDGDDEEEDDASMVVSFVLPDNYVGGMPTKFNVYYELKGGRKRRDTAAKRTSDYPSSNSITIDGLSKSTYSVWTTGENSEGEGIASPKSEVSLADPIIEPLPATKGKSFYEEIWFIILIILLILLIILVILVYCCCNRRGGGKYPVGEKEKEKGGWDNQPLKDYTEIPMEDTNGTVHSPTDKKEPDRPTKNGAGKKPLIQSDDDADSLDDYCEDKNFGDDGSFIGQYGDDEKRPEGSAVPV